MKARVLALCLALTVPRAYAEGPGPETSPAAAPASSDLAHPGFDLADWHERRDARLERGMATLLGWGLASTVGGVTGRLTTEDPQARGFWEMTAGWGLVNAGLGALSLLTLGETPETRSSLGASLERSHTLSSILWLNAGLDVGWMALGAWLWERGHGRNAPGTEGFGQAIVVQGAALLLFDVVMGLIETDAAANLYPVIGDTLGIGGRF